MKALFAKKWVRVAALAAGCAALVYSLVYVDVLLRARTAYLEGEKYMAWHQDPKLKETSVEEWFSKEKDKAEKEYAKKRIDKDEFDKQMEILAFTKSQKLKESSVKYAYIWYQTVIELFSPPESKWVKLSREKMPKAKELWKEELKAKNIPFEDYMID